MNTDVWQRAANNGLAIIAFNAYSKYGEDGNIHEEDLVGLRFVCIDADSSSAVVTDGYFYISSEDSADTLSLVGSTPDQAMELYIEWRGSDVPLR
jgi:hypothetical protein